ncbi:DinB family protein [Actinopolymorpha pittospori]|uniref:DinB-like domain-containing protein n=1 Tax=Actinopolymorpha pittospori TaxID=648752 RepID=A0A927N2K6_9ACTN|nr:DinB family protein [Actinopolymorpha pittospori]MBE1611510.1 hypothetical protein [Actinopolymorpha pittospori]
MTREMKPHLLELSDFAWERLWNRLAGLTDEEYLWEPVPDSWTIRRHEDGSVAVDSSVLPLEPPPFTTLAWRIAHVTDVLGAERTATWFGLTPLAGEEPGPPQVDAKAALAALEHAHASWRRRLDALDEEALARPMGKIAGPYGEQDGSAFALHILDELIHHGAEIGVVRDLFRASRPRSAFVDACLRGDHDEARTIQERTPGIIARTMAEHPALVSQAASRQRWDAVLLLLDLGFGVDAPTPSSAPSPLHYAAGAGELDVLRRLVTLGADLDRRDPTFQATPLGWAEFLHQEEAAAYLSSLPARQP